MEPFIGQIMMVGFNYPPRGWALCDGQLLQIAQFNALFALLGTTYGGDGRTTFALPDLRGRFPIHQGSGPGLTPRTLGQRSGAENSVLNVNNLAAHSHTGKIVASGDPANTNDPTDNALGLAEAYSDQTLVGTSPRTRNGTVETNTVGGNQSFTNMPPFLCINFVIALEGIFPPRA